MKILTKKFNLFKSKMIPNYMNKIVYFFVRILFKVKLVKIITLQIKELFLGYDSDNTI